VDGTGLASDKPTSSLAILTRQEIARGVAGERVELDDAPAKQR
jgi:hypothetical protein